MTRPRKKLSCVLTSEGGGSYEHKEARSSRGAAGSGRANARIRVMTISRSRLRRRRSCKPEKRRTSAKGGIAYGKTN